METGACATADAIPDLSGVGIQALRIGGVQEKKKEQCSPRLASGSRALGRCQSRWTGVDEGRAIPVLVNTFEVNYKLAGVVLGERHNLGTKESDNMVGDDFARFILEVCVVDAEVCVEPVDFVCDKLARDKPLWLMNGDQIRTTCRTITKHNAPWPQRHSQRECAARPCP